ncbi:MAG: hypothetical protein E7497_04565 [Ruminococcus sp.]|nr:hypothetical protein [Ruminococcus sp.]
MDNYRIFPEYAYEKKQGEVILPGNMDDSGGGMGYEGYMVYDLSELDGNNPWTEDMKLETLPVFRNQIKTDDANKMYSYYTQKQVQTMFENASHILGLTIDSIDYQYPVGERTEEYHDDNSPVEYAKAECDGAPLNIIRVDMELQHSGALMICFEAGIWLPENIDFRFRQDDKAEADKAMKYLLKEYRNLIQLENPVLSCWFDRTYKGEAIMKYSAYNKSDDNVESILNYNFRSIEFSPEDRGLLHLIRINNGLANTEYIGDYPIITADEAREMLFDGEYITTVPHDGFDAEDVEKVELIYRSVPWEEYFQPYYRFYVNITDEASISADDDNLIHYGAYYVPAVEEAYREDITLWDGSFNGG